MSFRIIHDEQSLAGITNVLGFGEPYPIANTEDKAIQNLYVRLNYNYNHDEFGNKKYKIYPTEAYSKKLIGTVLKDYGVRANAGNCLTSGNINTETGKQIFKQVASSTGASEVVTTEILRQLFYAARDGGKGSISEKILCPNWEKHPTADQTANYNAQKKLQEEQAAKDESGADCGFWCRIGKSATDFIGAPATAAKTLSILLPVTLVGIIGGITWIILRKINQVDANQAIKEQGRNARAAAWLLVFKCPAIANT